MVAAIHVCEDGRGCFRAWCPALPGCVVWGGSRGEAAEKIHLAVSGYLAHVGDVLPAQLARMRRSAWLRPNARSLRKG